MTDHSHITLNDRDDPVLLAWPTQGNAGGFIQFEKAAEWRAFVDSEMPVRCFRGAYHLPRSVISVSVDPTR